MLGTVAPESAARPAPRTVQIGVTGPHAPSENGLRIESTTVYDVDPARNVVHVVVETHLTNEQPNRVVGGLVQQLYFRAFTFPVLKEATNLVATNEDGTSLSISRSPGAVPFIETAEVDLAPDLFYRDTDTVTLRYDLPNQPPRADGSTRVNRAFVTFFAFAAGDPGLTRLEVRLPASFAVEVLGSPLERTERDGVAVYSSGTIGQPDVFASMLIATDDAQLVDKRISVGEANVNVRAWPGDGRWRDFVTRQVTRGVPALVELIGQPWPIEQELEVVETVSPYIYGYAGYYDSSDELIGIGDILEPRVILHELAHAWFNTSLFNGRWINEGFAEEYATRVARRTGGESAAPTEPAPIVTDNPARVALNEWGDPSIFDDLADERELYGYNASWYVVHELVNEIGIEKMGDVIDAAAKRRMTYVGDVAAEQHSARPTWQHLLDLLENTAGSKRAAPLFERHVVDATGRAELGRRRQARREYAALEKAGAGWSPPLFVREPMTGWNFFEASEAIAAAHEILEVRDDVVRLVEPLGIEPVTLENTYETAENIGDIRLEVGAARDAAEALREADGDVNRGHGIAETVGLWWSGAGDDLDAAKEAFVDGDHHSATELAQDASSTVRGAGDAGLLRIVGAVLAGALAFLGDRVRRTFRARKRDAKRWIELREAVSRGPVVGWLVAPGDPTLDAVDDQADL